MTDALTALHERIAALERENEQLSGELLEMERLDRRLLRHQISESDMMARVLDVIGNRLLGATAAVALASSDGHTLRVAAASGLEEEAFGIPLEANSGPVGQTLRSGSPRSFPARRFHVEGADLVDIETITVVPMRVPGASPTVYEQDEVPGVILVATSPATPLQGSDLEFLRRIGIHAAVLLENSRLFDSLQRSEETYRTMVEQAHLGMALLDRNGRVRQTNGPMRELLGVETGDARSIIDFVAVEDRATVEACMVHDKSAPIAPSEVTMIGPAGNRRVRLSVTAIRERHERINGHVLIARDVTEEAAIASEREAMARKVQQFEKLSAVGQFVAGIAHELNNPLTVVIGYCDLLEAEESLNPRLTALVEQVLQHAQRCGRIVADLLTFSRHEQRRPEPVQLADVIRDALAATRHKVRPADTVVADISRDLPPLYGSSHALCQLVTNVVSNALDAVALSEQAGRIVLALEQRDGEQRLTIQDNGPGLTNPERIFDPFYTTKPIGKGTGLGLSICYGIARDHGGTLQADNAPEGGARLTLVLPEGLTSEAPLPTLPPLTTSVPHVPVGQRRHRLLVVDDEPGILELVSQALASSCEISTAETVEEGLTLLETTTVDLVLTDLRLPAGMTGPDFYEEIAVRWPQLTQHVAFMTGDTVAQATQAFLDRVQRPCLQKPFKISQLVAFVRAQLDEDAD